MYNARQINVPRSLSTAQPSADEHQNYRAVAGPDDDDVTNTCVAVAVGGGVINETGFAQDGMAS